MSKINVRGYLIDIAKVRSLAEKSKYEAVRSYHERSLGMIENALDGCTLNDRQHTWLERLQDNVENQYNEEIGV